MADKYNVDPGVNRAPGLMPSPSGVGGNPGSVSQGIGLMTEGIGSLFSGIMSRNQQQAMTNINRAVAEGNIMPDTIDRLPGANPDASTTPSGVAGQAGPAPVGGPAKEQGIMPPPAQAPVPTQDLPANVQSGINRTGVTQSAYKQGKMQEEHYWNMVSMQMRDLIAKNPAYAKEIEKAYEVQYGFNPNKKANETFFEGQRRQEAELKDEEKRWRETKAEAASLGIPADQLQSGDSNPQYRGKVEAEVLNRKAQNAARDQRMKALEVKEKEGKDVANDYYKSALETVEQEVNNLFHDTTKSMEVNGVNFATLSKKRDAAMADGIISDAERQELSQLWSQFEMVAQERLNRALTPYYSKIADPAKFAELKKETMGRLEFYKNNIIEGKTGILNWNKEALEQGKAGDANSVRYQSEEMRKVGSIQAIGGDNAVNMFVTQRAPQIKDDVARIRLLPIARDITNGRPLSESLADKVQGLSKEGTAQVADEAIKGAQQMLLDPKTSPDVVKNTIKSLFGDKNANMIESFTPNSRAKVFGILASPAMTERMGQIGKTDPKALRDYQDWTLRTFNGMMSTHISNLKDTFASGGANSVSQMNNALQIGFDGSQFTVSVNPKLAKMGASGRLVSVVNGNSTSASPYIPTALQNTVESVREMNRALQVMRPIVELNKEGDLKNILDPILGGIGVSGEAKNDLAYVAKAYNEWKLSEEQVDKVVGRESKLPKGKDNTPVAENPRTTPAKPKGVNVAEVLPDNSDFDNLTNFVSTRERPTAPARDPSLWGKPSTDLGEAPQATGGFAKDGSTKLPNGGEVSQFTDSKGTWHQVKAPDGTWSELRKGAYPMDGSTGAQEAPKTPTATSGAAKGQTAAGGVSQAQQMAPQYRETRRQNPYFDDPSVQRFIMDNPSKEMELRAKFPDIVERVQIGGVVNNSVPAPGKGVMDSNYPDLMNYMRKTKGAESGGNTTAQNPKSSARGLYQFTADTWNRLRMNNPELKLTPTGRDDPAQQERAMAAFTKENEGILRNNGIPINDGSRYLAHFVGSGGAVKVYKADPNASVEATLGSHVVAANPFLKGKSNAWLINWASRKMK